jgi:ribosomal protein S18 acetylase RimI-like enzyme
VNARIRRARVEDLPSIVDLHMRAFPGFFLSTLGHRFLLEVYRGFLNDSHGRIFVAETDGTVVGFVAGTLAPDSFFRNLLLCRWFVFAWSASGAILRRPRATIPRLLSALRYRGERPSRLESAALLSSIAVEPDSNGLGIGKMLLTAYREEARVEGRRYVYLTTDRNANEAVNRFYLRHSFAAESEIHRPDGRTMVRYVSKLMPDDRDS